MNRRTFIIGIGIIALTPVLTSAQKRSVFNETWDKFQPDYIKESELVEAYAADFNNNPPAKYKTSAKRISICDELIETNKKQSKCYEKLKRLEKGE